MTRSISEEATKIYVELMDAESKFCGVEKFYTEKVEALEEANKLFSLGLISEDDLDEAIIEEDEASYLVEAIEKKVELLKELYKLYKDLGYELQEIEERF